MLSCMAFVTAGCKGDDIIIQKRTTLAVPFLLNTLHVTHCMSRISYYNTLYGIHCMLYIACYT